MNATNNKLAGQIAIITGAAQGMGAAVARRFVEAGAGVVLADLNGEKAEQAAAELRRAGHTAIGLATDVTVLAQVKILMTAALDEFDQIDILVNSAGILRSTRIEGISKAEWDLVLNVNLNGTFLCTQAVIGPMKARGYGRIVNLASLA